MRVFLLGVLLLGVLAQDPEWISLSTAFTQQKITDLEGWTVQNAYKDNKFSTCGSVSLVGGYAAFGTRATASKGFKVPPHYKLKINVQLWKFDSWDNEFMQIYVDGFMWQARWNYAEGTQLCGSQNPQWNDAFYNIEFVIPHNMPNADVVFTSTLDQDATDESWGFRDFKISYLPCPPECGVCSSPDPKQCFFWNQRYMTWFKNTVSLEDWTLTGGNPRQFNCGGVNILGGYENFGGGAALSRVFTELPPHFKVMVKFQFWKIDSWDDEEFRVNLDGALVFQQKFGFAEGIQLCGADSGKKQGSGWGEKVVNIELIQAHTTPQIKVGMTSTLDQTAEDESWGVRDFFLFVASCHKSCKACTGPSQFECTACASDSTLVNGICEEAGKWYVVSREFDNEGKMGELQGWTFVNVMGSTPEKPVTPISRCGDVSLVGGYGKFGKGALASKTFNTAAQAGLRLQVQLWKIDSWDGEELFITMNGQKVYSITLGLNDPQSASICGNPNTAWMERIIDVDVRVELRNATQVQVNISSTLDQDAMDESWGFRNFALLYIPKVDCVVFYSECEFKGKKIELCHDEASLSKVFVSSYFKTGLTWDIKSIKIPGGQSVEAYQNEDFGGKQIVFKQDQACIDTSAISFAQVKQSIQWVDVPLGINQLRRKQY